MNLTGIKNAIKNIVPPRMLGFITGLFYGWNGNYSSWEEARLKCTGYDSDIILETVRSSASKIRDGVAVYERDSVIFDKIEYSYPLLAGIFLVASGNNGKVNVLDFGGSLGSSYYQNKKFLDLLSEVNWCVVEQSEFVRCGMEQFSSNKLHFFYSIKDCTSRYYPDVVLFSSVLQYLPEPFKIIDEVKRNGVKWIVIDRTGFVHGNDRLTIQKVHPSIYKATYPCWFFDKQKFLSFFMPEYEVIIEFDSIDKANINAEFKGFLLKRSH